MPRPSRGSTARSRGLVAVLALALPQLAACPPARAQATFTAQYEVRFDGTWSAVTHPIDFPASAHFSALVGGTHNSSLHLWAAGELASQGIQDMAERGRTTPLDLEVQAAIGQGSAGALLLGGGISPAPGTVSLSFALSQLYPRVTLVSMIAPTPDWFVGVDGLELFQNGQWVQELVVPLQAWDAGTDSGPAYTSPNQPTVPHVPVTLSTAPPFASGTPLGTFTFTRIDVPSDVEGSAPARRFDRALGFPTPFQQATGVRFALASPGEVTVSICNAAGRQLCVLQTGRLGPGEHFVPWNGLDAGGAHPGSGVYFFRVQTRDRVLTAKVVRVN
jgi:hypothetical protein